MRYNNCEAAVCTGWRAAAVSQEEEIDWDPDKQSYCSPKTVWSPIWWYGRISPARPLSWEPVSLLPVCAEVWSKGDIALLMFHCVSTADFIFIYCMCLFILCFFQTSICKKHFLKLPQIIYAVLACIMLTVIWCVDGSFLILYILVSMNLVLRAWFTVIQDYYAVILKLASLGWVWWR